MVLAQPLAGPMPDTSPVVRLKRGREARGTVLNDAGLPVAGAQVSVSRAPGRGYRRLPTGPDLGPPGDTTAVTDAAGHFALSGLEGTGQVLLVTWADGQQFQTVHQPETGGDIKVVLPKPASLTVRYDIPGDAPEAKVSLQLETGDIGMYQSTSPAVETSVSNRGRITLTNLTPGTYEFSRVAETPGMTAPYEERTVVIASGQSQEIDLVRTNGRRVGGQIVGLDRIEIQNAIFEVQAAGADPSDIFMTFSRHYDVQAYPKNFGKDGKFQTALLEPGNYTFTVQVYEVEPEEIRMRSGIRLPKMIGSADVTVDAAREPAPLKIELHDPATRGNRPAVQPGTNGSSSNDQGRSGGTATKPSTNQPSIASTNFLAPDDSPKGQIEGTLRVGSQPGANRRVTANYQWTTGPGSGTAKQYETTTDRDGKFTFKSVPSGTLQISALSLPMRGQDVTVEAGKTNHVTLGGGGRTVTGKLLIPAEVTNSPNHVVVGTASMEVLPGVDIRPAIYSVRVSLYHPGKSGDGERLAPLALDGTFRAEDVPPGTWSLLAEILTFPPRGGTGKTYAVANRQFVVAESSSDADDVPLDFGRLDPVLVHSPQIGEVAPLFELPNTAVGVFKLADHRGQYVLLDFEELFSTNKLNEPVKAVWSAFGKDGRVAMLTVQMPPTMSYMNFPDREIKFPWPLARLQGTPWYELESLRAGYGLPINRGEGMAGPVVFLIGPDGKIVARDLQGDGIKAAVAKALGK